MNKERVIENLTKYFHNLDREQFVADLIAAGFKIENK